MAAVIGQDGDGVYAVVHCDEVGCSMHVALRPYDETTVMDLLHAAIDTASDEGWLLIGVALCPRHGGARASELAGTVAEGIAWANVTDERPSMALRPS